MKPKGQVKRKLKDGGRKPFNDYWENNYLNGLLTEEQNGLHVSRKLIKFKAKQMQDEKCADESENDSFVPSRGWVKNFMKRF